MAGQGSPAESPGAPSSGIWGGILLLSVTSACKARVPVHPWAPGTDSNGARPQACPRVFRWPDLDGVMREEPSSLHRVLEGRAGAVAAVGRTCPAWCWLLPSTCVFLLGATWVADCGPALGVGGRGPSLRKPSGRKGGSQGGLQRLSACRYRPSGRRGGHVVVVSVGTGARAHG